MPMHDWTRVPAGIYHDFHFRWLSSISDRLNTGILPRDHYSLVEQVAIDDTEKLNTDILALRSESHNNDHQDDSFQSEIDSFNGGLAVAVIPPKVSFVEKIDESQLYALKAKQVSIRHVSSDRIVALIELVSPGNKASNHELTRFVNKAIDTIKQGCHLLIIDPFPPTRRDPHGIHATIWSEFGGQYNPPINKPLTMVTYDAGVVIKAYLEPIAIGDTLTDRPLLLTSKRYVPVPLEETYNRTFETLPRRWQRELV